MFVLLNVEEVLNLCVEFIRKDLSNINYEGWFYAIYVGMIVIMSVMRDDMIYLTLAVEEMLNFMMNCDSGFK